MYRQPVYNSYDRGPHTVSTAKISLDEKPLPPLDISPKSGTVHRTVSLEPQRHEVGSRSTGSLLAPPRPTRRDRHPALSLENLRALRTAYSPNRNMKPEVGQDSYRSTSSTAVEDITDDTIFVGPPLAENHPLKLGVPEQKRPRMDIPSARMYGYDNTADLAYFLKTTGPSGGHVLPPRLIQEPIAKEEQGTLKRMIGLGVSTFRKRKETAIVEMYEKVPTRNFDAAFPSPKIVQKISKTGTKYLQIITDDPSNSVEELIHYDKTNEPESPRISVEIANANVIDVEDFEKWLGSFSVQARESEFVSNAYNYASPDSTLTPGSQNMKDRSEKSGFGLSILDSSGSELASPTATHSSATSPTLTNDEKPNEAESSETKLRPEVGSLLTVPTLSPLNMDSITGISSGGSSPTKRQDEEWIQREMMQIQSPVNGNFQADSPVISPIDSAKVIKSSLTKIEVPKTEFTYRTSGLQNWTFNGNPNFKPTPISTSPKRSATRPTMRQSKSSHDVHSTEHSAPRASYTIIPPLLQSPIRPKTSGEREEDITALPQMNPPTMPLPSTPDRKRRKHSKPLPNPLNGFPVPPGSSSNGNPSPTQTHPYGQLQSTRSSTCSINTANSRRVNFFRLQSRIDHLERENRLLQAALQAVLRTSGTLNGCPCGISKEKAQAQVNAQAQAQTQVQVQDQQVVEGVRRGSADSQGSNVSALDLYHRTRLARVSNGARSL